MIKYLIQINHIWKTNKDQIIKGLKYKYCKPKSLIDLFYDVEFFYWVIKIFNLQYNFREFTKKNLPALNIIADDLGFEGRTHIGDSRIRNIPILFIPHAAIPSFDEIKTTINSKFLKKLYNDVKITRPCHKGVDNFNTLIRSNSEE